MTDPRNPILHLEQQAIVQVAREIIAAADCGDDITVSNLIYDRLRSVVGFHALAELKALGLYPETFDSNQPNLGRSDVASPPLRQLGRHGIPKDRNYELRLPTCLCESTPGGGMHTVGSEGCEYEYPDFNIIEDGGTGAIGMHQWMHASTESPPPAETPLSSKEDIDATVFKITPGPWTYTPPTEHGFSKDYPDPYTKEDRGWCSFCGEMAYRRFGHVLHDQIELNLKHTVVFTQERPIIATDPETPETMPSCPHGNPGYCDKCPDSPHARSDGTENTEGTES